MASNKRDICRQEGEVLGRGEGGGVFFRKQPRKDKREPPKHELYKKLGMEGGGGEVVEGTQK